MQRERLTLAVLVGAIVLGLSGCRDTGYRKQNNDYAVGYIDKNMYPIYNLRPDAKFTYRANEPLEVECFTDSSLSEDSKVEVVVTPDGAESKTRDGVLYTVQPVREWERDKAYYLRVGKTVIPFRTASIAEKPVLGYSISDNGELSLIWSEVAGATGYKIYKSGRELCTVPSSPLEFRDFSLNGSHGIGKVSNEVTLYQNYGLARDDVYSVSAVVGDRESAESNRLAIADIAGMLPVKISGDTLKVGSEVSKTKDLPRSVGVEMLDGGVVRQSIEYEIDDSTRYNSNVYYGYHVLGTELRGYIEIAVGDRGALQSRIENGIETYADAMSPLAVKQDGEKELFGAVRSVYLNAYVSKGEGESESSGFEEYLISALKAHETEISLKGYPAFTDTDSLQGALTRVLSQNLIYGVERVALNADRTGLTVEYSDKAFERQIEIYKAISGVKIDGLSDMDAEAKEDAIYRYINDNFQYEEGSDIYAMVTEGRGNAVAYAQYFKDLCRYNGVDADIVTGCMYGRRHTWNSVKIGDSVVYVDAVNCFKNTGVTRICYNMSPEYAKSVGYVSDRFIGGSDNSHEYYSKNGLVATNLEEYKNLVRGELDKGKKVITIRYTGDEIPSGEITSNVAEVYKASGKESLLKTLRFGDGLGYYVLWNEE